MWHKQLTCDRRTKKPCPWLTSVLPIVTQARSRKNIAPRNISLRHHAPANGASTGGALGAHWPFRRSHRNVGFSSRGQAVFRQGTSNSGLAAGRATGSGPAASSIEGEAFSSGDRNIFRKEEGATRPLTGEPCSTPVRLVAGRNVVAWLQWVARQTSTIARKPDAIMMWEWRCLSACRKGPPICA